MTGADGLRSTLRALTKARVIDVARGLSVPLSSDANKDALIERLMSARVDATQVIGELGRDELRVACRLSGLDDSGRSRADLAARLLGLLGAAPQPAGPAQPRRSGLTPTAGDVVRVRHRQYLVREVVPPLAVDHATLVRLVCLDDDAQGRALEVMWELELGAAVENAGHDLGDIARIDPPRHFAAYLHALKWNCVSATDARLFQSPFRAGIKLMTHQLTPLKRALELPRANLFIADDVGLGKTIEAGLVLGELLLRQRVDFTLIACPAAVALQWRDEMEQRFGLRFEIYNRTFLAQRRQERGFGTNAWTTHTRFIISYQTLRRPENRDPLLARLGDRASKSLLILDEAHNAAPASASKYAVDSRLTKVVRDIAPRFENRLFLSATPHNGHSNSFSALLEVLDPQRFTRGVPVEPRQLESIMVRRLKSDLRALGSVDFPERKVVQIELRHDDRGWSACPRTDGLAGAPMALGAGSDVELDLSRLLAEYTRLMRPTKGRGRLVFINLQKRLLSSVEAFYTTLRVHAKSLGQSSAEHQGSSKALDGAQLSLDAESDEYGVDDDIAEETAAAEVESRSRGLPAATGRARELLDSMLALAEQHRGAPDAKVLALLDWIRTAQLPGAGVGGCATGRKARTWSDRRVIIFTEYGDTKRYLVQQLRAAIDGSDEDDARILQFHGGMSDDQRAAVQTAFNGAPDEHTVRILVATDAAREGVNLQCHCADLFHFDIPWNPARMEQRNGRIDRTLQPAPEVRCAYFIYPERVEDLVLDAVIRKVGQIQRDLGSLSAVVMDRIAEALDAGIDEETGAAVERAAGAGLFSFVERELETQRVPAKLRQEIDEAGRILNASRAVLEFDPRLLRDAIDVGCELAGAGRMVSVAPPVDEPHLEAFTLPELTESWQPTLDTLRPPRARDEAPWEWRKRPPLPVTFTPPARMRSGVCHLHLQHPLVQRVLSRFLAQGYSAHDLSRVTILRNPKDALVRVVAFGRISLFGTGATRLHDQLIAVAAQRLEGGGPGHLVPFADEHDRAAVREIEQLLSDAESHQDVGAAVEQRLRSSAPADFAALWPHIEAEADHLRHEAERKLGARASTESEALRRILAEQRAAIRDTLADRSQLAFAFGDSEDEQRQKSQFDDDRRHMEQRLAAIDREVEREPVEIARLYDIVLRRVQPVGLVYLWPTTR